ncbi:glycosyl hydrolase family 95 catalytic domain-containing protein [Armatimonas sp.]|uniref:glycoside hydrolase family 95 protein n=1 Tax=Armatimonas sp. TaxID=1872638 RepID=UPI0037512ADC
MHETTLWYEQPATHGDAALPVGNRRLEARVFGGIEHERIQLNEESLQSLGDLFVEQVLPGPSKNYRRSLDLDAAVASTAFTAKSTRFTRDVFSSATDNVIIARFHTDTPGSLNLKIRLTRGEAGDVTQPAYAANQNLEVKAVGRDSLALRAQIERDGKEMHFACFVRARVEGGLVKATDNTIQIVDATLVTVFLTAATSEQGHDPEAALATLEAAFHRPYNELLARHQAEHQRLFRRVELSLPTANPKVPTDQRLTLHPDDPGLAALYFHYGRYLLIASSRPGRLPANLQGLMHYWPAEVTSLSDCHEALFDYIESLVAPGKELATQHYGSSRGWVAPADGTGEIELRGGAWLCQHLFEHWCFAPEKQKHLRRIYPILKGASEFLLDFEDVWRTDGASMDLQITRECWENTLALAQMLSMDDAFQSELERALEKLSPPHISHAYAFYPGNAITLRQNPEQAAALKKTLDTDLSRAWLLCLAARFDDSEAVQEYLSALLTLDSFGATAGIAECLLQSHAAELHLLPALPPDWKSGSITGLRARGGITVSISWEDGKLTRATLICANTLKVPLRVQGSAETKLVTLPAGKTVVITPVP